MLLAVDAYSIIHRAYHAFPPNLVTKEGTLVNAAYGFTAMLLDVLLKYQPDHVFIAFDMPGGTFRNEIYVDYKAHRGPTDDELSSQIPIVKEIVEALNIPWVAQKAIEADDILGTVSKLAQKDGNLDVLIVSGDRDLLQLVNKHVSVLLPKGSFKNLAVFNEDAVKEYWGVRPDQVVDLKALMGDASDNIPGVRGIGPKTAQNLINQYNTLEGIYEHIEEVTGRTKQLLVDGHETAVVSQQLAAIKTDVALDFNLEHCLLSDFDYQVALSVFQKLGFKSLLGKLQKVAKVTPEQASESTQKTLFKEEKKTFNWQKEDVADFKATSKILLTGEYEVSESIQAVSELQKSGQSCVLVFNDSRLRIFSFEGSVWNGAVLSYGWIAWLKSAARTLSAEQWQDLQKEVLQLVESKTIIDNQLLKYALMTGRTDYDIDGLQWSTDEQKTNSASLIMNDTLHYLVDVRKSFLNQDHLKRWESLKHNDVPVINLISKVDAAFAVGIAELERNGIRLDLTQVATFKTELEEKIAQLEKAIYEEVGHEFNIRSTKQLGTVLFQELNIPPKRKTKTGYSTDDGVLQELKGVHPAIPLVLDYRMHYKLYSTYVLPFLNFKPDKGDKHAVRLHSTFNQIASATGRLSSTNPNLQNLPIRTEVGQKIRTFFKATEGNCLVSLDYSQIDLRVMAELSQDKTLIKDFVDDRDIHRSTASAIFSVPYDKVDDSQRRVAKTINFGVMYGLSPFGLASTLQIEYHEAEKYINEYFEKYQGIAKYMHDTIEFISKHGYVESLLGRRRMIVGIDSRNPARRNAAIREAINMPVQGGSDDIMRLALIALQKMILEHAEWQGKVRLVLHIHDELVFEMPDDKSLIKELSDKAQEVMAGVIKLKVPIKTGVEVGQFLG